MNRKQQGLALILSLFTGLVGGMLASQFCNSKPAFAKKAQSSQKVIVAEEFRLVDKAGRVRSTWGMDAGGPGIVLFSEKGEFRAVFSLTSPEEGAVLTFADKEGKHRTVIGLGEEREPYLTLHDKEGKERLSLTLAEDGDPFLLLYDKDKNERAILGTVDLTKLRRTGSIEKRSISSLVLVGDDGKVVWKAP